jgi:hypothetical protein
VKAAAVGSTQAAADFAKYLLGAREGPFGPRGGPVSSPLPAAETTIHPYSPFRPDMVHPYTPFTPPGTSAVSASSGGTEAVDILRQIRDFISEVADRPPVIIGPVDGGI